MHTIIQLAFFWPQIRATAGVKSLLVDVQIHAE
jgi:hypothetical protein